MSKLRKLGPGLVLLGAMLLVPVFLFAFWTLGTFAVGLSQSARLAIWANAAAGIACLAAGVLLRLRGR